MRDKILIHAVRLAAKHGYTQVTRSMVAKSAGVAPGSVSYHFDSMKGLQDAIVSEAVGTDNLSVIAQALLKKHRLAQKLTKAKRLEALQHAA